MWTASAVLAVGCLLAAGCAAPLTMTPSASTAPPPPDAPWAGDLVANDCASLVARAHYPLDTGPGQRPAGWNRSAGVASELEMGLYACRRVAVAGLERPVALLLEAHGNVDPPAGCRQGDWNVYRVLHAVWTNDTAVAAVLAEGWGVPVRIASLERTATPTGEAWSWEQGRLEAPAASLGGAETATRLRFAWPTGDGVSLLDVHERSAVAQYQVPLVTGEVAPPLLAAERSGRFVGEGGLSPSVTLEAKLARFGDALCESPRSS